MKISVRSLAALTAFAVSALWSAAWAHEPAVAAMLDRIGGAGTSERFVTELNPRASEDVPETFTISSEGGKPKVSGNTLSAITTGLGWYLNHYASINVSWNNPHPDLTTATLPVPTAEETHTTDTKYRYYLNYCTFSYSMSTWTWDRWQQEIDWMALHGINMPLQIVGFEEVWRKFLMEDCNYTKDEVNDFVAGPAFQAWFGMNNLEGHGGPNPDWWYERQAKVGRQITDRMREMGMDPVLPGFYQVPSNFASKTNLHTEAPGGWCGFSRPCLPTCDDIDLLNQYGAKYYQRLNEVLGEAKYFSMDPFHEGGNGPTDYALKLYQALYNIMDTSVPGSHWVIQQWQWHGQQRQSLQAIPKGKLIVIDLNSERVPAYGNYNGHETIFCTIFNFGGRTGFDGRFQKTIDEYFKSKSVASVKGIGAAPEAIEQTPVAYDMLFELPWLAEKPDGKQWMAEYANRRYGQSSPEAAEAWELLRTSALEMPGTTQGPHEAIICGRPALSIGKVSSWGGAEVFYNRNDMTEAAYKLIDANLGGFNYSFDVTDIARQALTDYAKSLLAGVKEANAAGDTELFGKRRDAFLQLILDLDELLNTNSDFMLGHWTERARAMADDADAATTDADKDWLELDNARTIITTWGKQAQSEAGGLRDYSYREWGGMLKDFYYQRWKTWFDNGMKAPTGGWFQWEWNWAHSNPGAYNDTPIGDTHTVATAIMSKYLSKMTSSISDEPHVYIDRLLINNYKKKFFDGTNPGVTYSPNIAGDVTVTEIAIDFSTNGLFDENEIQTGSTFAIPEDAPIGERNARVTLSDGTVINYTIKILVDITEDRTVAVVSENTAQGTVAIDGAEGNSVTNKEIVSVRAIAGKNFDFSYWTDQDGNNLGNDNPLNYYDKEDVTLTAHFVVNKWGVPEYNGTDRDRSDMKSYQQYINKMTLVQGGEATDIYTASECPEEHFVQIPMRIKAAPGSEFTFNYTQPGTGMKYLYLSAWIDLNNDGKFKYEDGELLKTIGTRNKEDNSVGAGSFSLLLPYNAVTETTHIRLRFDGAWGGAYDEETKAFPADAPTNRVIYEIILEVVESAEYATTVTYEANNSLLGSMRSENEAMAYNPGDEVILTAFPNTGVHVKRWVDQHGRELPSEWITDMGRSVSFKTFDNAHITCEFEPDPIEVDGWSFNWMPDADGQKTILSTLTEGEPVLDLSSQSDVIDIEPEVFAGSALTDITLPSSLVGLYPVIYQTSHEGAGQENHQMHVVVDGPNATEANTPLKGTLPWVMIIEGETGSGSFNQWGSVLFSNGTNGSGDNYSNGWSQFYLKKEGVLVIKWDGSAENKFDAVNLNGRFKIRAEFDGDKSLKVTVTNGQGQSQTKTIANSSEMKPVWRFVNSIPAGMKLTYTFTEPEPTVNRPGLFEECRSLMNINMPSSGVRYQSVDGVLYDKAGKCVAYPEGRLFSLAFRLRNSDSENEYMNVANIFSTNGAIDTNDESRMACVEACEPNAPTSIFDFSLSSEGKIKIRHRNSDWNFGGVNSDGFVQVSSPSDESEYTYSLVYGKAKPAISLWPSGVDFKLGKHSNSKLNATADSTPVDWLLEEVTEYAPEVDENGMAAVAFPLSLVVPESDEYLFNIVPVVFNGQAMLKPLEAGAVLKAGEPFIITKANDNGIPSRAENPLSIKVNYDEAASSLPANNLLRPALTKINDMPTNGTYYTVGMIDGVPGLTAQTAATISANTPYLVHRGGFASLPFFFGDEIVGDANCDGVVNVGDVTTTVEYILKEDPQPFSITAADVNGEDGVDVGDVVGIVNIILGMAKPDTAIHTTSPSQPIRMARVEVEADGSVWVDSPVEIGGIELTATGHEWTPAADIRRLSRSQSEEGGNIHAVAYGNASTYLPAGRIKIGTLAPGSSLIGSVKLCDSWGDRIAVDATPTGINGINADLEAGRATIHDLSGRRLSRVTAPGFYIVNGVKTLVR
ncbi:MAG: alpha-N-acetylglucosaminidase C-terminal domain-containing protein [Pseudoflavonifractor sp.]|nr:alpha-N-acetylglucosaminidase C-terminal domain-containing protein [Pseudoflavonifractor sp.]